MRAEDDAVAQGLAAQGQRRKQVAMWVMAALRLGQPRAASAPRVSSCGDISVPDFAKIGVCFAYA